eukprot:28680-Rhodomonas_salina.1
MPGTDASGCLRLTERYRMRQGSLSRTASVYTDPQAGPGPPLRLTTSLDQLYAQASGPDPCFPPLLSSTHAPLCLGAIGS